MKMLIVALLGALGSVTHDYLQPMGFDMNNNSDDGYQVALDLLKSH